MTKPELIKEVERLEQELHNAQNSVFYWTDEACKYTDLYNDLKNDIEQNGILNFIKECSIVDKQKVEDFISTL